MNLSVYVGRPYETRGCWELLRLVYSEQLGITLPSYAERGLDEDDRHALAALICAERVVWQAVPAGAEQGGDAVLMRIAGEPMHIGVVVEPGRFLHVRRGHTACIESYRTPQWRQRVEGFYRHA